MKVGDEITSATTGKSQNIIYLHPIEEHECYRINFIDGTSTECSEGHLWLAYRSHDGGREKLWTAKQIFEFYEDKKNGKNKDKCISIPLCAPVSFKCNFKYPIDPYILGVLIGDGSFCDSNIERGIVTLTTPDQQIIDDFETLGYDMSRLYKGKNKNCWDITIREPFLIKSLKRLGLAGHTAIDKFIPEQYKYASIDARKEIIRGLMDTDGYVDARGHMSYSTISKQLAEDVAFVIRSLGGVATIKCNKAGYKKDGEFVQCNDCYDVYIRTKIDPELVTLERKQKRCRYDFNGGASIPRKRIIGVDYIGKHKGRCITVSEPSGLYIVENFTVTHNSFLGCCWLAYSCIRFEGIRMVVARKVRKTLLETTWNTLMDVLASWGLKRDVHFHVNNLAYTITFWNGSVIMAMDLTPSPGDPDFNSLGSLEITGGFIDEVSEVSEKAVEVLASRVRYKVAETFVVGKMLYSTNPCLTWVRSTFVMDDDGNPVTPPKGYRYIPFSLFDNPNEKFRAIYYNKLSKLRNKADRDRLLYGNWLFTTSNKMAAYWEFDGEKHLIQNLKESHYDKLKPLILSFDFNVNPYMSCLPLQIDFEEKIVYIYPEYVGYPKDKLNNTPAFTRWIANQLVKEGHIGGVLLTGDPAGLARSTQTEEGVNNFTIANKNLTNAVLHPKIQLLNKQPAMVTRLEFVNELLKGYNGWKIMIDARCHRLTEDFVYQKKNPDGTKEKKKVLNDSGDRVERYGHFSDCLDYALIYYLNKEYSDYKTANSEIVTTVNMGETVYGDFDY